MKQIKPVTQINIHLNNNILLHDVNMLCYKTEQKIYIIILEYYMQTTKM